MRKVPRSDLLARVFEQKSLVSTFYYAEAVRLDSSRKDLTPYRCVELVPKITRTVSTIPYQRGSISDRSADQRPRSAV